MNLYFIKHDSNCTKLQKLFITIQSNKYAAHTLTYCVCVCVRVRAMRVREQCLSGGPQRSQRIGLHFYMEDCIRYDFRPSLYTALTVILMSVLMKAPNTIVENHDLANTRSSISILLQLRPVTSFSNEFHSP